MNPLRICVAVAIAFTSMAQAGCDRGPKFGPPATLTKLGDLQSAAVGSAVAVDPAVLILDADGRGVPGVQVTFAISAGGGSLENPSVMTDKTGTATLGGWTLGTAIGSNTIVGTANGVPGSPVIFSALATAGPIATLTKLGSDPTSAPAGGNIDSIAVRAADQFGNPVSGLTILFAVTTGGGTVSPASRLTLADGRAAARWTLGPAFDVANTATAATQDGSRSVTFSTVSTRAVTAVRIADKVIVVDSTGTTTPTIVVTDQTGATVPGAPISLATRNPAVASAGASSVTGSRTGQTFLVATSVDNQAARDSALVIVGNIGAPVVRMTIPRFDLKSDTTFTVSLIVDMRLGGAILGAATLHLGWDPTLLTFVSDEAGSTSALTAVNTTAAASGALSVAMASSDGVPGAVEVRKLTFKASATVGKTGSLAVNVIDLSAAGTFTNLVPVTVSGTYPLRIR